MLSPTKAELQSACPSNLLHCCFPGKFSDFPNFTNIPTTNDLDIEAAQESYRSFFLSLFSIPWTFFYGQHVAKSLGSVISDKSLFPWKLGESGVFKCIELYIADESIKCEQD